MFGPGNRNLFEYECIQIKKRTLTSSLFRKEIKKNIIINIQVSMYLLIRPVVRPLCICILY
jgi:hypothetical protein